MPEPTTLEILAQLYNACDPFKLAPPEYYLDCAPARGSGALTRQFQKHLALGRGHTHFLFSGHVGCGKSSELAELRRELEGSQASRRYFTVLLNASEYLDDYDAAPTDLLLAIVTELAHTLREKLGVELKDRYFTKRLNEVKEYFLSDAEIDEGELSLGNAKAKITRLPKDPEARQKVRAALAPKMSSLLEEINAVFAEADLKIKQHQTVTGEAPYSSLVLILDNLEKIRRIEGQPEGIQSQHELFIERAPQLRSLQTHVIYTVPLSLARASAPQLTQRYGSEPMVLPMVKVMQRSTREPYKEGLRFLRELVEKRLAGHNLQQVFSDDALQFLLKYSGGHIRNLMIFIQNSCAYAEELPISLEAAHHAIQQEVRLYSTAILENHWKKLA